MQIKKSLFTRLYSCRPDLESSLMDGLVDAQVSGHIAMVCGRDAPKTKTRHLLQSGLGTTNILRMSCSCRVASRSCQRRQLHHLKECMLRRGLAGCLLQGIILLLQLQSVAVTATTHTEETTPHATVHCHVATAVLLPATMVAMVAMEVTLLKVSLFTVHCCTI